MDEKECFGAKIRAIRKSKGITQEKFSEMIDLSPRQMVKIEMGHAYPSVETLKMISKVLDVPMQYLFENDAYDSIDSVKQKLISRINQFDEQRIRFLYSVSSLICTKLPCIGIAD